MKSRLVKILATLAIAAVASGFLVYSSMGHTQYYKMVDELMADPEPWLGKTLRVHGFVEAGSIDERIVQQKTVRSFIVESKGERMRVKHEGPKPDTFKDLSEVVAKGTIIMENGEYVLEATELMAKCPSKYEGAAQNKDLGQQAIFE